MGIFYQFKKNYLISVESFLSSLLIIFDKLSFVDNFFNKDAKTPSNEPFSTTTKTLEFF